MQCLVNGVTLWYETTGEGAPLLLLHGNGESHEIFDAALPLLATRFKVYAIDTRGHGKSSPVAEYHYRDMAEDIIAFVGALDIQKPVLYGFSDGGIVALIVGMLAPWLPKRIIASGANCTPRGLNAKFLQNARREWKMTKNPLLQLMLTEPHIGRTALARIGVPVDLIAGEHDIVRTAHTLAMARALNQASLHILAGETHESYIVHSEKIARILLAALQ